MTSSLVDPQPVSPASSVVLLPKDRSILERTHMEFRPFGMDEQGRTIRDLSGMSVRAIVLYLERIVGEQRGDEAGADAVRTLCGLLNQRIKDPIYHVTPDFLTNAWNSYSYEFAAYLYELCQSLSGDPEFLFKSGMEKASPIMQVLARPFSLEQIYGMFPYFGNKFASGSIECRVIRLTAGSATLAMRFTERTLRQFGPYRRRCAHMVCQSAQGILAAVPAKVHGLPLAQIEALSCIADDDDWCRWTVVWRPAGHTPWRRHSHDAPLPDGRCAERPREAEPAPLFLDHSRYDAPWMGGVLRWSVAVSAGLMVVVHRLAPDLGVRDVLMAGLVPLLLIGMVSHRSLRNASTRREALIREQINYVESRHEELREAYLEQEQTRVQLRRKVAQLTALHRAGLLFSSTLDRGALLEHVLEALTGDLHYDRAMVSFFDPGCRMLEHVRITGVSADVQAFAASCRIPVTDPESPEGSVVLQGRPLLIEDIRTAAGQLHPLNQTLVELTRTKTLIVVPLKTKDRILGALMVDRAQAGSLTADDLELMSTLGSQVAIALDNALAYEQIEEWNVGLELKVRQRTAELEKADRLRAQFLSHVSHELKTPLTSIKGFLQNLLDGLTGPLNDKQERYVCRMLDNADRLIRMISDLLDRTSIEAGRIELNPVEVDLQACLVEAVEQLRPLAHAKRQTVELCPETTALRLWADRDRLIQIIVNLIQNAVKYTPECGLISVHAEEAEGGRMGRIVIRDTGPGVPDDCLDKVFDPFFRVQQGQRTGPKGLGLGLSIVKTLVKLQGGRVGVCTRPEGGAEFSFTLPALACTRLPQPSRTGAGRILVADDDPDIRQLLQDRLLGEGFQVCPAADDRQALEALSEGEWRGAILDIGLGAADGLDLLRRLREHCPTLPIIMITASGSQDAAVRAIGMGAQAYLLKPFDADELQRVVRTFFTVVPS